MQVYLMLPKVTKHWFLSGESKYSYVSPSSVAVFLILLRFTSLIAHQSIPKVVIGNDVAGKVQG